MSHRIGVLNDNRVFVQFEQFDDALISLFNKCAEHGLNPIIRHKFKYE